MNNERRHLPTGTTAKRSGGVGGLDESFSDALIKGRPFLHFENLRGKFDSQLVEAFFSSDRIPARIPYRGEIEVSTRNFFVLLSSNGVETTRDFANRSAIVRIRKRDGHQFKTYPEGELLEHVRANQGLYLGCVFAILKEWLASGKPFNKDETRHDFRRWSQTLDLIVTQCFKSEARLLDGHQLTQARVINPTLSFVRSLCLAAQQSALLDTELTATDFLSLAIDHSIDIPHTKPGDDAQAKSQIGAILGRAFKDKNLLEVDNFQLSRSVKTVQRDDGRGTFDLRVYHVSFQIPQ